MNPIEPEGFKRFWSVWPRNSGRYSRKGAKSLCLKVWIKNYNETQAEIICKHVVWLSKTGDWLKDQGAFIPAPLVYLNQMRWDGADIPAPGAPMPLEESRREREARERVERIAPGAAARRPGAQQQQWEVIENVSDRPIA